MEYLRTKGSLQFIQNSSSSLCPSIILLSPYRREQPWLS